MCIFLFSPGWIGCLVCVVCLVSRGVAGDLGFDHQRVRHPPQEGTPPLPAKGPHPATQAQVRASVSPAA